VQVDRGARKAPLLCDFHDIAHLAQVGSHQPDLTYLSLRHKLSLSPAHGIDVGRRPQPGLQRNACASRSSEPAASVATQPDCGRGLVTMC
jgi:hypothetical protein